MISLCFDSLTTPRGVKCEEHGLAGGATKKRKSIGGGEKFTEFAALGSEEEREELHMSRSRGALFGIFKPNIGQIKRRICTLGCRDNSMQHACMGDGKAFV